MRGSRGWIAFGIAVMTLVLLGIRMVMAAKAGQGSSILVGMVLAGVVICAVVLVVFATMARQLSRIRASGGPDVEAWRAIDPQRPSASRFLLVSSVHGWARLTDKHGQRLAEWNGDTLARVEEKPLHPSGSLVSHLGLSLHARDGSAVEILLPSSTTLTYPARYREEATRALIAAFGPAVAEA